MSNKDYISTPNMHILFVHASLTTLKWLFVGMGYQVSWLLATVHLETYMPTIKIKSHT